MKKQKTGKIVSAVLTIALVAGTISTFTLASADVASSAKFDEKNVVLSFGSMSDLHFSSGDAYGHDKMLKKAVETFQDLAGGKTNLNAVVVAGDLTDYGTKPEFAKPGKLFNEALDGTETEVVFAIGNHDAYGPCDFRNENWIKDAMGSLSLKNPVPGNTQEEMNHGNYHTVINGVHFITVYGVDGNHANSDMQWLDKHLKIAQDADPSKPIIVTTHVHPADTCYGSIQEQTRWYSTTITPVLAKYPQAISYTGHTHFPNQDDTTLWQGTFTSINTGSMRYMSIKDGYIENGSMQEGWNGDSAKVSNAQFTEVDKNGIVRVRRINLDNGQALGSIIKDPYVFPVMKKASDAVYSNSERAKLEGPSFKQDAFFEVSTSTAYNSVSSVIEFGPATAGNDMVHHYSISIRDKATGKVLSSVESLAQFYLYDDPKTQLKEANRKVYLSAVGLESEKDYQVCVSGVNSYGTLGTPLVYDFKAAKYTDKVTYDYNFKALASFDSIKDGTILGTDSSAPAPFVGYSANFGKKINLKGVTAKALSGNALSIKAITSRESFAVKMNLANDNPDYANKAIDPQMLCFFVDGSDAKSSAGESLLNIQFEAQDYKTDGTKANMTGYKVSPNAGVVYCTKDKTETIYANAKGQIKIKTGFVGRILIPIKSLTATNADLDGKLAAGEIKHMIFAFNTFFIKNSEVVIDEIGFLVPKTEAGSVEPPLLPGESNTKFAIGDVNRDNKFDTRDPLTLLKYSAAIITLDAEQLLLGDYNNDTIIDTRDALSMLKKLVGIA